MPGERPATRRPAAELSPDQREAVATADQRYQVYRELRDVEVQKKLETTLERSAANVSRTPRA